jgi:putative redox protein
LDAKVIWNGRLSFTGKADSGFSVPVGAEVAVGGDDDGLRPMELILTGLAGCTAMDVASILQKKRQDVTAFVVQAHAERAEDHPKVITSAVLEYQVSGHAVDEAALLRAIELSATRYCPAQAMFKTVFPMRLKYTIFEDEGEGRSRLVKEGEAAFPG